MADKRDFFGRLNRPTMLQVKYMEELSKLTADLRKRGGISAVAEICGVNHSVVSRFFKSCIEAGYINEKNKITDEGMEWLNYYCKIRDELEIYFRDIGVPEAEIADSIADMEENMEPYTIRLMLQCFKKSKRKNFYEESKKLNPLASVIEKGQYAVSFRLLKYNRNKGVIQGLSMSDKAFEKPALLKVNNRGVFLVLTFKEIYAQSGTTGNLMKGHMTGLKYEFEGKIVKAPVRERKVRIPVEACMYKIYSGGGIRAALPVTFSVNVGNMHMPESTALLVFWF